MSTPEEDDALRAELEADGAQLQVDASAILAEARRNEILAGLFDRALDIALTLGGGALSAQLPGAAFAVAPAKAVLEGLAHDAVARRIGKG